MCLARPVGSAVVGMAVAAGLGCGGADPSAAAPKPAPPAFVVIAPEPEPAPVGPAAPAAKAVDPVAPATRPTATPDPQHQPRSADPLAPPVQRPLPPVQPPAPVAVQIVEPAPKPPEPKPVPEPETPAGPKAWPKDVGGKTLPEWLAETRSPDPAVRESAARIVTAFGPDARRPALKDMVRLITDSDPGVRMSALTTISEMLFEDKDDQKQVFDALRFVLANSYAGSQARLYSVRALAAYGADAATPANISALDQMKADTWWMTRQAVANGLGRIGAAVYDDPPRKDPAGRLVPRKPASDVAAKTLRVMVVNDPSAAVRLEAVFALIAIGPPNTATTAEYAKAVAPSLEAMNAAIKKEKDGAVAVWLYVARSMYDEATFPDTLKQIGASVQDPSIVVRSQALTAALMLGTRASTLIPQVRDCLNYDEPELLAAAIPALASVAAKDPQAAVPDLEKFKAKTKNDELKRMADEAIAVLSGKKKAPAAVVADAPPAAADPKPMAAEKR